MAALSRTKGETATTGASHFGEPVGEEVIQVGERTYVLEELTLGAMFEFGNILIAEAHTLAEAGLLQADAWADFDIRDSKSIVTKLFKLYGQVPQVLMRLVAIALGANAPDDAAYLEKHLKFRQFLQVIEVFMQVNPWPELADRLSKSRAEVSKVVDLARRLSASG